MKDYKYEVYLDGSSIRIKKLEDYTKTGHIYKSAKSAADFIINYLSTNEGASYQDIKIDDNIFSILKDDKYTEERFSSNRKPAPDVLEGMLEARTHRISEIINKNKEKVTLVEFTFRDELYDRVGAYLQTQNQKIITKQEKKGIGHILLNACERAGNIIQGKHAP